MLLRIILPAVVVLFSVILIWFGFFGFSVTPKMIEKEISVTQVSQ